jgi:outer membrane lipoprotein-sorting protein
LQPNCRLPIVLALIATSVIAVPGHAQTPAPPTTPTLPTMPAAPAIDLLPLKKALVPLAGNGALQSFSDLQMTGSKAGISFTFREQAHIIAKRPGRFHADLTQMAADGTPQLRLTVISNGLQVWTYRPSTRQYSVTTYKAFQAANNDVTALGLAIGGFFLGEGHQLTTGFQGLTASNTVDILTVLKGMDISISSKAQSANGEDDLVYQMALLQQGLTYQFAVDSQTDTLRRVELAGTQKSVQIAFKEVIKQLAPKAEVSRTTFVFTPPPGAIKVKTLSVDPF